MSTGRFPHRGPALAQAVWLAFGLSLFGCTLSIDPNRNSGPDGERYTAPGTELNKIYNDEVNFDNGDATDWRYLLTAQQGLLTLTCHFDEIDSRVEINLRDAVGNILATQLHNGQPRQVLTATVNEGKFYVEVKAIESGSASTYTCEPKFVSVIVE